MNDEIRNILKQSMDLKEASTKRAMKSATNPAFTPVYEGELKSLYKAREWLAEQKNTK